MFGIPANLTKHSSIWSLAGLALALSALGCAASAPSQPTSTIAPTLQPTEVSAPAPKIAAGASAASGSSVKVGSGVGDRIPDFVLDLGDGSTVTSQQLLSEGQPTFLFLFATW